MTENVDRVWKMMDTIGFCMLATLDGTLIRSRPMAAYVRRTDNAIYFLSDARQHKDTEIRQNPTVNLAFADASNQKYVSVAGVAEISNDRQKVRELWSTPAKAWWDSPDDPDIRVLKVTPIDAEFWDSPGTVVSYVKMALAAVSSARPNLGDNEKVAMR